jgi:hypothetical protein
LFELKKDWNSAAAEKAALADAPPTAALWFGYAASPRLNPNAA